MVFNLPTDLISEFSSFQGKKSLGLNCIKIKMQLDVLKHIYSHM